MPAVTQAQAEQTAVSLQHLQQLEALHGANAGNTNGQAVTDEHLQHTRCWWHFHTPEGEAGAHQALLEVSGVVIICTRADCDRLPCTVFMQ